jgi:hypothetical protein
MKGISVIICLLCLTTAYATDIPLKEAILKKWVECTITGNPDGTHYTKPLLMKLKNLKGDIRIVVENGQIFTAADTSFQDFVVTRQLMADLKAGQTKNYVIYGMCIKEHNSYPGENISYKPGSMADEKLKKLTLYIQDKNFFNQTAQQAVWVMRDSRNLNNLCGYESDGWEDIVKFTASLLNVPVPERPKEDDYERNYNAPPSQHVISGAFEIDCPVTTKVTVGLFNKQGIIVRELYNNPQHPKGLKKVEFEFDANLYPDKAYDFKMIIDGEVFLQQEVKISGR